MLVPTDGERGAEETEVNSKESTPGAAVDRIVAERTAEGSTPASAITLGDPPDQLTTEEALEKLSLMESSSQPPLPHPTELQPSMTYCPECYLPLHPDPKPEKLYIFLHALRYTTSLGCFETEMPEWARKGYVWDREA